MVYLVWRLRIVQLKTVQTNGARLFPAAARPNSNRARRPSSPQPSPPSKGGEGEVLCAFERGASCGPLITPNAKKRKHDLHWSFVIRDSLVIMVWVSELR